MLPTSARHPEAVVVGLGVAHFLEVGEEFVFNGGHLDTGQLQWSGWREARLRPLRIKVWLVPFGAEPEHGEVD